MRHLIDQVTAIRGTINDAEYEKKLLNLITACDLSLGKESPERTEINGLLCNLYANQARFADAKKVGIETLGIYSKLYGENHPSVIDCTLMLGMIAQNQGDFQEADRLIRKAVDTKKSFWVKTTLIC